jgi:DNA polymerase elongation subunit (family B)
MKTYRICVHAYHWKTIDAYTENEHEEIQCWSLNADSKPCLLRFQTFPVFCNIELPPGEWSIGKMDQIFNWLKFCMKDNAPLMYQERKAQTLYYYQGQIKKTFMTIMFKNQRSMSHCYNLLSKPRKFGDLGTLELKVHETQISSIRKMLTSVDLKYCQWFSVDAQEPEEKVSKLENEYIVDYRTIKVLTDEEAPSVTSPYVLSFDIECYSHNKRIFTNERHPKHCVFMIQLLFKRLGDDSTKKRFVIYKGDIRHINTERATVFAFSSEKEVIDKFAYLIDEMDPDLIIGYNIMSYDYPYLNHRLMRFLNSWVDCGRLIGVRPVSRSKKWKSGMGYMNNEYLDMDGRLSIDLLPIIKRDYKLRLYILDHVSKFFLGRGKHDISAAYMFEACEMSWSATEPNHPNWDKACEMMTKTAEYGIEDTELSMDIFEKINGWIGLTEMSSIVGVNIIDLFISGQQMRCESLLYNKASKSDIVIDKRPMPKCEYSGGFVFEPKQGIDDHVIGVDFKSLYPSIIAAYNICFSTLMNQECRFPVSNDHLNIFDFEQEEGDDSSSDEDDDIQPKRKKKAKKVKMVKHYYEFVDKDTHEGLLPSLVTQLVKERDAVRKKQKSLVGTLMWTVLQQRQLALKVTANSFYGFLGVQEGGRLPLIEGAMCITAKGRELILQCNKFAEDKYNATVVYNDSVTGDTPIILRNPTTKDIFIREIKDIGNDWLDYPQFKPFVVERIAENHEFFFDDDDNDLTTMAKKALWYGNMRTEKMCCNSDMEVWTHKGWAKIKRVIRHKVDKKIYRVSTKNGVVDVTEDHSLIRSDNEEPVRPKDMIVGETSLLHKNLDWLEPEKFSIETDEAWLWGFFMYNGSFDGSEKWAVYHTNLASLHKVQNILKEIDFVINELQLFSSLFKLSPKDPIKATELYYKYYNILYVDGRKRIPDEIINSSFHIRQAFYDGFNEGNNKPNMFIIGSKIVAQGLYILCYSLGMIMIVGNDNSENITLEVGDYKDCFVERIKVLKNFGESSDYVYDISTTECVFNAGVGSLIAKNTDSSFFKIPSITNGAEADRMGKKIAREMTELFPPPLTMEFEKAMRVLRFKKKKYAYVEPDEKGRYLVMDEGDINSRGILTARRDNCAWVRNTYMAILIAVMRRCPLAIVMRIILRSIKDIIDGNVSPEDLAIVKGLGANYRNESYFMNVFSEELKATGQPVKAGERLEYVVVETKVKDDLLGKKMRLLENYVEDPEPEPIDVMYYLNNQIMNPVDQIVAIAYRDEIELLKDIGFQPGGNYKFTSVVKPIKMIYMALMFNTSLDDIQDWILRTFPIGEVELDIWKK